MSKYEFMPPSGAQDFDKERMAAQLDEALGDDNRRYTRENVGEEVFDRMTAEEQEEAMLMNYFTKDGTEDFRRRWPIKPKDNQIDQGH
jgi:hypothetical protein